MIQTKTQNIAFGTRLIKPTTKGDLTQYSAFYTMPKKITSGFELLNKELSNIIKKDALITSMAKTPGSKNFDTIILTHLKEGQETFSPFEKNVVRLSVAELNKMKNTIEVAWNLMGHYLNFTKRA